MNQDTASVQKAKKGTHKHTKRKQLSKIYVYQQRLTY